ncbi:kynureninase [Limibacter armeniacum]|uniref:kynureninase n=1 Tax=Limibacter armeniacum TaxID=466084 RepID=UPI002FE5C425
MNYQPTKAFAQQMDQQDKLSEFRDEFHIPLSNGKPSIYFCGNSLGAQPKSVETEIALQMENWRKLGVDGHFYGDTPWYSFHDKMAEKAAPVVGAKPHEVAIMNTLTVNLHLMMVTFYQPRPGKHKIMMEAGAFPSDQYAVESQVKFHGYDPEESIIELSPRDGEKLLRTEDIIEAINTHKDELALIMMGGINYYTGQVYDMAAIAEVGHKAGIYVGFDLAHIAGNVPVKLHDWDVDFAVWCTYKYMNSSPGGISGAFIHERFANNPDLPRFAGWWGHDKEERFLMEKGFKPVYGAEGWQLSNYPILLMAAHWASLQIFDKAGIDNLRAKSIEMTNYLEFLVNKINTEVKTDISIITPTDVNQRGCQLSLVFGQHGRKVFEMISEAGVICDWREPDVIRIAPVPLYNTFSEVLEFSEILKASLLKLEEALSAEVN